MRTIRTEQLAELAVLLKERVGLHIRPDGHSALRLAISARLDELNGRIPDASGYLSLLRSGEGDEELRRLLPLVTVGKTSFFRDDRQFGALHALLPELLARPQGGGRKVAIWSAGCATGEEPYSIAMSAAEAGASPDDVEILATDVNPEAVAAAVRGSFDARRVRDVPKDLAERHFDREGERFRIRAGLRRLIAAIRPHNLVASAFPRPADGGWDVIFCRNVIIYFDTPTTQQVLAHFHSALAPGGYLFLGYSESLFRLFDGFELTEVAGAFLYRRPEASVRAGVPAGLPIPTPRPGSLPAAHPPPVHHLEMPRGAPARAKDAGARAVVWPATAPPPESPPLAPQEYLDGAIALFADGRFGAARELLEPLSAEAHLFFGIHLLAGGELDPAALELSRALFLDPDLALAHYYLGRCREAQRDPQRARLAYRNAIEAFGRRPDGKRQAFLGYYPDIPEDGAAFARAAEYALAAL